MKRNWILTGVCLVLGPVVAGMSLGTGCMRTGKAPETELAPAPEYVAKPFVPNEKPTYHGDIAHLVDRRCIECHHEGGPAPFALDNFKAVAARSAMIRRVVEDGTMPPWFMAPGVGKWKHDRSLSDGEKTSVGKWIANGLAEGNPSDSPKPRTFPKEWLIGTPDRILQPEKPIAIPATGTIPYVNYDIALNNPEPLWVEATQVIPGDLRVVHHVVVSARGVDDRGAPTSVGTVATWSPGGLPEIHPSGTAMRVPSNAVLHFQMHYTPFGEATKDSTRLGVRLAKGPVRTERQSFQFTNNQALRIPAGVANHVVTATYGIPADMDLARLLPHAHYRGKSMRLERIGAEGKSELLLDVPRFDFNWQLDYEPVSPIRLRKGDVVRMTFGFDNSARNRANPNPRETVLGGEQTENEMMVVFGMRSVPVAKSAVARVRPVLLEDGATNTAGLDRDQRIVGLITALDTNGDGDLTKAEARACWKYLASLDSNKDQVIDFDESLDYFGM